MQVNIVKPDPSDEYYFEEGCHILELLNDPQDDSLSIARARVKPGQATRRHYLRGTVERYLILSGTGDMEIDGCSVGEVAPGDLVLIQPERVQSIRCTSETELVFYAICTPRFRSGCYKDAESGR